MHVDGRTARAQRTRAAIVDAAIECIDAGDLRPTATKVAELAGVSIRSIFQHFDDVEGLYMAVTDAMVNQYGDTSVQVATDGPFEERILKIVEQRVSVLEQITPLRRLAESHQSFSPAVAERLRSGRQRLLQDFERLFEPELRPLSAPARALRVDMISMILGWPAWDDLRRLGGRSVEEARSALEMSLRAVLAQPIE